MKHAWEFWAVVTQSGNAFRGWIGKNKPFQARIDATFRRLQDIFPSWPMPYYRPLGEGVGEIRFDFQKAEHRIFGYFSGRKFVILFGHSDKKTQGTAIKTAKKQKKHLDDHPPQLERYDV